MTLAAAVRADSPLRLGLAVLIALAFAGGARAALPQKALDVLADDADYYAARGVADLKEHGGGEAATIKAAEDNARFELAQTIEAHIKQEIQDKVTTSGGKVDEDLAVQASMKSSVLLQGASLTEPAMDEPKKGVVTVVAYIGRKDYAEKAAADLAERKADLLDLLESAKAAKEKGDFAAALRLLADARQKHDDFFLGKPLLVGKDDAKKEFPALVAARVNDLVDDVAAAPERPEPLLDPGATATAPLSVALHEKGKTDRPLAGLAVLLAASQAGVTPDPVSATTDADGKLTFSCKIAAASTDKAPSGRVTLSLDLKSLGLAGEGNPLLLALPLAATRKVVVEAVDDDAPSRRLAGALKDALVRAGHSVLDKDSLFSALGEPDYRELRRSGAQFLVGLEAESGKDSKDAGAAFKGAAFKVTVYSAADRTAVQAFDARDSTMDDAMDKILTALR